MSGARPLAPGWERIPHIVSCTCDGHAAYPERSPGPLCPNRSNHTATYRNPMRCQWVCETFAEQAGVFADSVGVKS